MPEKHKNNSKKKEKKKKKRLTKAEKEEKERKELEKLNQELKEVDIEIKKVALKNPKEILDEWEKEKNVQNSEGLTSNLSLDLGDSSPSLEMINPPQGRLVPLERTLQVETSAPNPLGNGANNQNEEFNPFKYSPSAGEAEGPKYMANYASNVPGVKRVEVQSLSINPNERAEVGFKPMYTPEPSSEMEGRIFNPAKKQDINELGREEIGKRKEVKYTPSGY
jgi:hypothetical protein